MFSILSLPSRKLYVALAVGSLTLFSVRVSGQPAESDGTISSGEPSTPNTPTPVEEPQPVEEAIETEQPAFYVHAELDRESARYREGDSLRIRVRCEREAYLYVLYQQADGTIFQIFPNSAQPNNRVPAAETVEVPASDDLFRWIIGAPYGKETVKVIASLEPLSDLSSPAMRSARFNRVSGKTLSSTVLALKDAAPETWSEVDLQLTTHPSSQSPGEPGARRWGIFFGVSQYMYHDIVHEDSNGEDGINLRGCHRDAQQLAQAMADQGQLDGHRVFVDAEATRANLEYAITQWLPSVSEPGDTVIITFSGHGGQITDDNGDEQGDQMDEVICPHDYMHAGIFISLINRLKANNISAEDRARLQELIPLVQAAATEEQAANLIMRRTCVSDDLFGRWLQKLTGRQVIVILDTCHSGGFAAQEKGALTARQIAQFDFLDNEMVRLKDIGQKEQAVLTAAKAAQVAFETPDGQNGLMSYFVLQAIQQSDSTLQLEDAYEYCMTGMEEFFNILNRRRREEGYEPWPPHQPHMKNYCTNPVVLKP